MKKLIQNYLGITLRFPRKETLKTVHGKKEINGTKSKD